MLFLGIPLVTSCVIGVYRFMYPSPKLVLSSPSPDGKLRLQIFELVPTPQPLMQSPYIYHIFLVDNRSGKPIPGNVAEQNNDSCMTDPSNFRITWTAIDVTVTCDNPGRHSYHTDFAGGLQAW